MIKLHTTSDTETYTLGAKLGTLLLNRGINREFIAVHGDLGAGKTVFTRGFVSVTAPQSRVKSPTYTIVNEYLSGSVPVYHFDFYRIEDPDELFGIGFDDYLEGGICIGEWCEKVEGEIPSGHIDVTIEKKGETERLITVSLPEKEEYSNVDLGI